MIQSPIFPTGTLLVTRAIADQSAEFVGFAGHVQNCIKRHMVLDSDCCIDDKAANMDAVKTGQRVFSVYKHSLWPTIWIITEWDRSITTVLFPEDY